MTSSKLVQKLKNNNAEKISIPTSSIISKQNKFHWWDYWDSNNGTSGINPKKTFKRNVAMFNNRNLYALQVIISTVSILFDRYMHAIWV